MQHFRKRLSYTEKIFAMQPKVSEHHQQSSQIFFLITPEFTKVQPKEYGLTENNTLMLQYSVTNSKMITHINNYACI